MLLSGQDKLPRLPVPDVDATISKFLKTVTPLFSAAEVERCASLARDFVSSGVGARLQELLKARDQSEPNSWLETWWNRFAYLEYRESVVINVSFAMPFRPHPKGVSQCRRAALITRAALEYKQMVDQRTLPPDPQPSDQLPHTRIFNCCRVPQEGCDVQKRHAPSETVVVIFRDVFWLVEGSFDATVEQWETTFGAIVAANVSRGEGVGVLTSAHRDVWTVARKQLQASHLEAIEKSAFVVCLDESQPKDADALFDATLMGDDVSCSNRWFDKPLQWIIHADGQGGLNGEHSPVDGEPVARLVDWVLDREVALENQPKSSSVATTLKMKQLVWNISPAVERSIRETLVVAAQQRANLQSKQLSFKNYGKTGIVALKLSPDAWVQASIQLAYYTLHKRLSPCYESASTRRHLAGRTEVGRTLTPELAAFVKSTTAPPAERYKLLRQAADAHVAYMKEAVQGRGVDRHILAFKTLAAEHNLMHPFLQDPCVSQSSKWTLSTSQLAVRNLSVGFGPVLPDGYGVCYQIHPNHIHYSVTSFRSDGRTNADAFAQALQQALQEMMQIAQTTAKL